MKAGFYLFLTTFVVCGLHGANASDCGGMECEDMDASQTFAVVEEILTPNRPSDNLWLDNLDFTFKEQNDSTEQSQILVTDTNDCPFDTDTECDIWRTKPIVREALVPRSSQIIDSKMNEFLSAFQAAGDITGNDAAATPFVERYKILMKSSHACYVSGMTHQLKQSGATDGLIYKFLVDDANFYQMSERCLVANSGEFIEAYRDGNITQTIEDIRMGCLCRGRDWFTNTLSPFIDAWRALPEFAESKFYWTYTDGLNRERTVSINDDVENVLRLLKKCP